MATLVVRNIETGLHARRKAVARQVLRAALKAPSDTVGLGDAMQALFEPLGGLDLPEIKRGPAREPPDFSGPDWNPDQPA
jgi:hypothetical protein